MTGCAGRKPTQEVEASDTHSSYMINQNTLKTYLACNNYLPMNYSGGLTCLIITFASLPTPSKIQRSQLHVRRFTHSQAVKYHTRLQWTINLQVSMKVIWHCKKNLNHLNTELPYISFQRSCEKNDSYTKTSIATVFHMTHSLTCFGNKQSDHLAYKLWRKHFIVSSSSLHYLKVLK